MDRCVCSNFIICIYPIEIRKGREHLYNAKAEVVSMICMMLCFNGDRKSVAHPHHATCLVHCFEKFIN